MLSPKRKKKSQTATTCDQIYRGASRERAPPPFLRLATSEKSGPRVFARSSGNNAWTIWQQLVGTSSRPPRSKFNFHSRLRYPRTYAAIIPKILLWYGRNEDGDREETSLFNRRPQQPRTIPQSPTARLKHFLVWLPIRNFRLFLDTLPCTYVVIDIQRPSLTRPLIPGRDRLISRIIL